MESVELMMAFEDAFAITIPNAEAAELFTVGKVTDYVTARLAAEGRPRDRDAVYAVVTAITCEQCGTTPGQLSDRTNFITDLGLD